MNVGTQTPRQFYKKEMDTELHWFMTKLQKLEKELLLQQRKPKETTKGMAKPPPLPPPKKKPATIAKSPVGATNKNNIQIGSNGTTLSRKLYEQVNWTCVKKAIRDLCYLIFGQQTLGTHTLTGRVGRGAVMYNRKTKAQLSPEIVEDILTHIMAKFDINRLHVLDGIRRACRNSARALAQDSGRA